MLLLVSTIFPLSPSHNLNRRKKETEPEIPIWHTRPKNYHLSSPFEVLNWDCFTGSIKSLSQKLLPFMSIVETSVRSSSSRTFIDGLFTNFVFFTHDPCGSMGQQMDILSSFFFFSTPLTFGVTIRYRKHCQSVQSVSQYNQYSQ